MIAAVPDPADTWETAIAERADEAARHRAVALAAVDGHVRAITEVIQARAAEQGRDARAEIAAMIATFRQEINGHLDRLAA